MTANMPITRPTAVKERHSAADFDVKPEGEAKPV